MSAASVSTGTTQYHARTITNVGPTLHHTFLASASSPSSSSSPTPASILAIATDPRRNYIFSSSSHSETIQAFHARTYLPLPQSPLRGHTSSILALELAPDRQWLLSASADGTVRVWDIHTLQCLYIILVQGDEQEDLDISVGDVFAIKWHTNTQTLFMGCQDTSIRWCNLARLRSGGDRARSHRSSSKQRGRGVSKGRLAHPQQCSSPKHQQRSCSPLSVPSLPHEEADATFSGPLPAMALPIPRPHKFFDSDYIRNRGGSFGSFGDSPGAPSHVSTPSSPGMAILDFKNTAWRHVRQLTRHTSQQHCPAGAGPSSSPTLAFGGDIPAAHSSSDSVRYVRVSSACMIPNAHYGYVYALILLTSDRETPRGRSRRGNAQATAGHSTAGRSTAGHFTAGPTCGAAGALLASGSGDEDVKLWAFEPSKNSSKGQLELIATLSSTDGGEGGAVLSLASWQNTTLFVGKQGGRVDIWDLETCSLLRSLQEHSGEDVLSLLTAGSGGHTSSLLTAGADGFVCRYDASFTLKDRWKAHGNDGSVLSCAMLPATLASSEDLNGSEEGHEVGVAHDDSLDLAQAWRVITGGSDGTLRVWTVALPRASDNADLAGAYSQNSTIRRAGFPFETEISVGSSSSSSNRQVLSFDTLLTALSSFVAFRSASSNPACREESRQCAYWLKSHLSSLGASDAQILPGSVGRNPLVLSIFEARGTQGRIRPCKRILFYGHYDVVDALDAKGAWKSSPWTLTGRDGYLYGRGVSDNKGPILAVAAAVQRLHSRRQLDVDVIFLIEGEEESGSSGFRECIESNKDKIGRIDTLLLSNSYWLDEQTPCLTMGMRGVVQCTVTICKPGSRGADGLRSADTSQAEGVEALCDPYGQVQGESLAVRSNGEHDVHSGVQGGSLREPMIDMVQLLSYLSDGTKVLIPGFYDDVSPLSQEERQGYEDIVELLKANSLSVDTGRDTPPSAPIPSVESLMARWRYPSLSVHSISVSGSGNNTIIPAVVSSKISVRLVPHQSMEQIRDALESFLRVKFETELKSGNGLEVSVGHEASWWVGDAKSEYTSALRQSIRDAWAGTRVTHREQLGRTCHEGPPGQRREGREQMVPISIREGGSIPAVSILEATLSTDPQQRVGAVHLPMGQSSDSAHLSDERIRLLNLVKGREIVEAFLVRVGAMN